jgi:tRNA (guanine-N7-)-methyltransferase
VKIQPFQIDPVVEKYRSRDLADIRAFADQHDFDGPIHVEVGTNRGRFLRGVAALHPEAALVGIEYRRAWANLALKENDRSGPKNAHVLTADAFLAIPMLFADRSLERLYVLFPDPWWKKRHAKRRMLSPGFVDLAASKLGPSGLLIVKTDVAPYRDYVAELMAGARTFDLVTEGDEGYPADEAQWPLTTRERNIVKEGLPVYRLYYRRNDNPPSPYELELPAIVRFPKPQ